MTVCTQQLLKANGVDVTFQGTSAGKQYWGCREPAPASRCHIDIDGSPRTICFSTNRDDASDRAACARDAGRKTPPDAPRPT